jgi:hypothetical protein
MEAFETIDQNLAELSDVNFEHTSKETAEKLDRLRENLTRDSREFQKIRAGGDYIDGFMRLERVSA